MEGPQLVDDDEYSDAGFDDDYVDEYGAADGDSAAAANIQARGRGQDARREAAAQGALGPPPSWRCAMCGSAWRAKR